MVDVDTVLGLLNEQRRRYTLYYLTEQDGPVHLDDVIEAVAEMETDPDHITVPDDKLGRIEIALRHNHLSKIDNVEFIEYNKEDDTIRLIDNPSKFDIIVTVAKVLEEV